MLVIEPATVGFTILKSVDTTEEIAPTLIIYIKAAMLNFTVLLEMASALGEPTTRCSVSRTKEIAVTLTICIQIAMSNFLLILGIVTVMLGSTTL